MLDLCSRKGGHRVAIRWSSLAAWDVASVDSSDRETGWSELQNRNFLGTIEFEECPPGIRHNTMEIQRTFLVLTCFARAWTSNWLSVSINTIKCDERWYNELLPAWRSFCWPSRTLTATTGKRCLTIFFAPLFATGLALKDITACLWVQFAVLWKCTQCLPLITLEDCCYLLQWTLDVTQTHSLYRRHWQPSK